MFKLTNKQHDRLDSLAQSRKPSLRGLKVVGLALGGCPILRDAYGRISVLQRNGTVIPYADKVAQDCKTSRKSKRERELIHEAKVAGRRQPWDKP
jgi:hypothetical protein